MDLPVKAFIRPASLREALEFMAANPDARPLAGGTDLVVQLRGRPDNNQTLVDLRACALDSITRRDNGVEIGAYTPMASVAGDETVKKLCPSLARAAELVGAWPIQCRATIGGNLANASPAADSAPPLLVSEAILSIASATGEREIPIDQFFHGPGESALSPGELIISVFVPKTDNGANERVIESFVKVGPRREQIISVVSFASRVLLQEDGTIRRARFAFGSVAPTPVRARSTEKLIEGKRINTAVISSACDSLQAEISPIDDLRAPAGYRRVACAVLLDRFLKGLNSD